MANDRVRDESARTLQLENTRLREAMSSSETRNHELNSQVKELIHQLEHKEEKSRQAAHMSGALESKETEVHRLEREVARLTVTMRDTESARREKEAAVNVMNQSQKDLKAEVVRLVAEYEAKAHQVESQKKQLSQKDKEVRAAEGRALEYQSENERRIAENAQLKAEISKLEATIDGLQVQVDHFHSVSREISHLHGRLEANQGEIARLERLLKDAQSKILEAESHRHAAETSVETITRSRDDFSTEIMTLRREVVELRETRARDSERLRSSQTSYEEMQKHYEELQLQMKNELEHYREEQMKGQLGVAQTAFVSAQDTITQLRVNVETNLHSLKIAQQAADTAEANVRQFREQLNDSRREAARLGGALEEKKQEVSRHENLTTKLLTDLETTEAARRRAETETAEAKQTVVRLEHEVARLTADRDKVLKSHASEVERLKNESQSSERHRQRLEETMQQQVAQYSGAATQLKEVVEQVSRQKSTLKQAEGARAKLQEQLDDALRKLDDQTAKSLEYARLQGALESHTEEVRRLQAHIEQISYNLNQEHAAHREKEGLIATLRGQLKEAETEAERWKMERAATETAGEREADRLGISLAQATAKYKEADQRASDLEAQLKALQAQLAEREIQIARQQGSLDAFEETNRQMQQQIALFGERIEREEERSRQLSKLSGALESKQQEINRLQSQAEALTDILKEEQAKWKEAETIARAAEDRKRDSELHLERAKLHHTAELDRLAAEGEEASRNATAEQQRLKMEMQRCRAEVAAAYAQKEAAEAAAMRVRSQMESQLRLSSTGTPRLGDLISNGDHMNHTSFTPLSALLSPHGQSRSPKSDTADQA